MKLGKAVRIVSGGDYVISRYEEYLRNRNPEAEAKLMGKLLESDRDRRGGWSASSGGQCVRRQQLTYLGYPQSLPKDRTLNIFANGDYVHARHQSAGLIAGYITQVEVPVLSEEHKLRGTMDGLLDNGEILEIKSIHTNGFSKIKTFGPEWKHKLQVHGYMLATGKDRARILYEDKNTQDLRELVIERDETLIMQIVEVLEELNRSVEIEKLAPMLRECKNLKGEYNSCPMAPVCESAKWVPQSRPSIPLMSSSAGS